MRHKDGKGRGRTTHHALRNQLLHALSLRTKGSHTGVKTIRHPRSIWRELLMSKAQKSRSPGADALDCSSSTRHSIHGALKNSRPRSSNLHRFQARSSCQTTKCHLGRTAEATIPMDKPYTHKQANPLMREDVSPPSTPPVHAPPQPDEDGPVRCAAYVA